MATSPVPRLLGAPSFNACNFLGAATTWIFQVPREQQQQQHQQQQQQHQQTSTNISNHSSILLGQSQVYFHMVSGKSPEVGISWNQVRQVPFTPWVIPTMGYDNPQQPRYYSSLIPNNQST